MYYSFIKVRKDTRPSKEILDSFSLDDSFDEQLQQLEEQLEKKVFTVAATKLRTNKPRYIIHTSSFLPLLASCFFLYFPFYILPFPFFAFQSSTNTRIHSINSFISVCYMTNLKPCQQKLATESDCTFHEILTADLIVFM